MTFLSNRSAVRTLLSQNAEKTIESNPYYFYLVPPRCNARPRSTLASRRPTQLCLDPFPVTYPLTSTRPTWRGASSPEPSLLSLPPAQATHNARPSISPRSPRRLHPAGPFAFLPLRYARLTHLLVGRVRVARCILMSRQFFSGDVVTKLMDPLYRGKVLVSVRNPRILFGLCARRSAMIDPLIYSAMLVR